MRFLLGLALACLIAVPISGQTLSFARGKGTTKARLLLSHEVARPGETVLAGVELTMAPGWHTYWQSAGDLGGPTEVHWAAPAGVTPGQIQWPVPEKHVAEEVTTFVYHGRVVLLVPLTILPNAKAGEAPLQALVKWLECEKLCVPGSNLVSAALTIGTQSKQSSDFAAIEAAKKQLPSSTVPGTVNMQWGEGSGDKRSLKIEWVTDNVASADFYPHDDGLTKISAATKVESTGGGKVVLGKSAEKTGDRWSEKVSGLLVRKEGDVLKGYEASANLGAGGSASSPAPGGVQRSIWMWLVYAFIGGLILNIMPCVLPVIALKILGFVGQSREHPGRLRVLGILYTLGVVCSFLVLAGLVIGVQMAGRKAGWGMQFSNPQFIVILTAVVTLVALNLFGVFEVTLSGRALSAAGSAASQHGSAGAFMNGVLATVLATPCTAPFLGASLGFAFAQPPAVIILFFVTIALGLASPYLLLSWKPGWLKFLPKPGLWMERFKVAMGFPLIATAVWLYSIASEHYGKRIWWLGVFLVLLSLAAWIFGTFFQRGTGRRSLALVIALVLLGGGFVWAIESELRWRQPVAETTGGDDYIQESPDGIRWRRWTPERVTQARAEGRPVFVDFTAAWCATCQVNKKSSIEIPSVRAKLKEINAVALLGDYTKFPPEISAELEKFGRAGVPLVLVYSRDAGKPPVVLPEFLTPGLVLGALDAAK